MNLLPRISRKSRCRILFVHKNWFIPYWYYCFQKKNMYFILLSCALTKQTNLLFEHINLQFHFFKRIEMFVRYLNFHSIDRNSYSYLGRFRIANNNSRKTTKSIWLPCLPNSPTLTFLVSVCVRIAQWSSMDPPISFNSKSIKIKLILQQMQPSEWPR